MANFFLTNKAIEDLSNIWDYTFEVWSESQADKYYEILIYSCSKISENPEIGKSYDEIDNEILGFQVNKHIIFYRTQSDKIEILRILHERMDLKSRIED